MRDPERITRILDKIEQLWDTYPDQRLGQLLSNYVLPEGDIFFPEDDTIEAKLDVALRVNGNTE